MSRWRAAKLDLRPTTRHYGSDETGDAYVVGASTLESNRIDAYTDRDGRQFLQERLVAYIADVVYPDDLHKRARTLTQYDGGSYSTRFP